VSKGQTGNSLMPLIASIYARGLAANAVLVAPFILGASALTLLIHPSASQANRHFGVTIGLALFLIAAGIAWGIFQSTRARQQGLEIPGGLTRWVGALVIILFASAFCEAQPFVLDTLAQNSPESLVNWALSKITKISALLAPVGAVIAFFASKMGEFIKSATESAEVRVRIAGFVAKVAIYFAGTIVPLLLWIIYLNVTLYGLTGNPCRVASLYGAAAFLFFILTLFMRPNANSLHPLYRDRLGEAFIFKPQMRLANKDLDRWRPLLSDISLQHGPYHLVNAALNVQHSKTANAT
jgi:hypothetical protein